MSKDLWLRPTTSAGSPNTRWDTSERGAQSPNTMYAISESKTLGATREIEKGQAPPAFRFSAPRAGIRPSFTGEDTQFKWASSPGANVRRSDINRRGTGEGEGEGEGTGGGGKPPTTPTDESEFGAPVQRTPLPGGARIELGAGEPSNVPAFPESRWYERANQPYDAARITTGVLPGESTGRSRGVGPTGRGRVVINLGPNAIRDAATKAVPMEAAPKALPMPSSTSKGRPFVMVPREQQGRGRRSGLGKTISPLTRMEEIEADQRERQGGLGKLLGTTPMTAEESTAARAALTKEPPFSFTETPKKSKAKKPKKA